MKALGYIISAFITFWIVEILSLHIADLIGPGSDGVGYIVTAISILSTIVVICTFFIVETIKNYTDMK